MSILSKPYFHDEAAAFAKLESIVWPEGPTCPKCGALDRINRLAGVKDKKDRVRLGLWKCYHCRSQFTCRVGTVFESSHVPLHKWLQAAYLMVSSKKGISANQLHRTLEVTLKTAWFMAHRLREAMKDGNLGPLGGEGEVVEVDETYIGKPTERFVNGRGWIKSTSPIEKQVVVTVLQRGGRARSIHVENMGAAAIREILEKNVAKESRLHTDQARFYKKPGKQFAAHESVNHSEKEYARGDVTTNSVEGFFGLFKRGMRGTYQHGSPKHLHRYLAEFDFRYNNRKALGIEDAERAENALKGIVGKRLHYKPRVCCAE